jgi:hypothetical protein
MNVIEELKAVIEDISRAELSRFSDAERKLLKELRDAIDKLLGSQS